MKRLTTFLVFSLLSLASSQAQFVVIDAAQIARERAQFAAIIAEFETQHQNLAKASGIETIIGELKDILNTRYGSPEKASQAFIKIEEAVDLLGNLPNIESSELLEKNIKGILAITRSNDVFDALPDKVGDVLVTRNTAEYRQHAILGRRIDQYEVERTITAEYVEQSAERLESALEQASSINTRAEQWAALSELTAMEGEDLIMQLRMELRHQDVQVQSMANNDAESLNNLIQGDIADSGDVIQLAIENGEEVNVGRSYQDSNVYTPSGTVGAESFSDPVSGLNISKAGIDLIIEFEVGGVSYYNSNLRRPTYPGAASGVTIGIGYDLGYNSVGQIQRDWGDQLDASTLSRLTAVAGLKRGAASARISGLRDINIPFEAALAVYYKRTLPRFAKLTQGTFPRSESLHGDSQGSLTSLVFNRGSALKGDRRREMRQIRDAVLSGNTTQVPDFFRSMERIWKGTSVANGLIRRRRAEAALFKN